MDPINTKFLRQLIRTLERIERRLDTPLNQHRYPEGKQQQSSKEQGQDQRPVEIRSVLSLPISVKRYYESEQRERASIWRKAKDVLEYVGVMTAISLAVLTWFTLQKVSSQAAAARDQVGMMQQQMEMTDRPWIKLVSAKPTQELHFMDLTSGMLASAGLTVIAENIGHSVALNVFLQARMTFAYDTKFWNENKSPRASARTGLSLPLR